ncbi:MAG: hypothetical protein LBB86_00110 [Oscillospiraceae bacterium]|jgi:hypothetical protein|nr:hypothetical protein [Oscillospiraceae bacterium]
MNIIHFRGLNCYSNSLVSVADSFGIDYTLAFGDLWSEMDLRYDPFREKYLSPRLLGNLNALGCTVKILPSETRDDIEGSLLGLNNGDCVIIGMDRSMVPWNPYFGGISGPHYFAAEYSADDPILCFDPTFNARNEKLRRDYIVERANRISVLKPRAPEPWMPDDTAELRAVAEGRGERLRRMTEWIERCSSDGGAEAERFAKYVEALINNRSLYRRYLDRCAPEILDALGTFDDSLLRRWSAVKHGLVKASVARQSGRRSDRLLNEIRAYATELVDRESNAAKRVVG